MDKLAIQDASMLQRIQKLLEQSGFKHPGVLPEKDQLSGKIEV